MFQEVDDAALASDVENTRHGPSRNRHLASETDCGTPSTIHVAERTQTGCAARDSFKLL
jgi:hypothetical protein